jgi:UDP-2,3-diacylglucosamine pyrophosphatase LpxH
MNKFRSIWVSDTHLGTKSCQAALLSDFISESSADNWYLVGDIIDGWRLKSNFYWNAEQTVVLRKLLQRSKRNRVIYITGNHDEFIRDYIEYDVSFGDIEIYNEHIHISATGHKFMIIHGDQFDQITRYHKWVAMIGDRAYGLLLKLNRIFNHCRKKFDLPYWSLSSYIKGKTKEAVNFIFAFEDSVAKYSEKNDCNGIICGHIHTPTIKKIGNQIYMNDGDWVESCSALVETHSGDFFILISSGGKMVPVMGISPNTGDEWSGKECVKRFVEHTKS